VSKQEECVQFISSTKIAIAAASLAALTPAAALAQDEANNTGETQYAAPEREDDDEFPWGLLGLLGLAGLAGLKRKERDIHVDARNNR
jgi:MYXO-CTERM domain-containing protein